MSIDTLGPEAIENMGEHDPINYFRDIIRKEEGEDGEEMHLTSKPKAAEVLRRRLKDENSSLGQVFRGDKLRSYVELLKKDYNYVHTGLVLDQEGRIRDAEYARALIEDEIDPLEEELKTLQDERADINEKIQGLQRSKDKEVQADKKEYYSYVEMGKEIEVHRKTIKESSQSERKLVILPEMEGKLTQLKELTNYGRNAKKSEEILRRRNGVEKEAQRLKRIKDNIR
jgi:hypothetical protein